jgi:hypothetical protein
VVSDINAFAEELKNNNGGDPLEGSEEQSNVVSHPRSSEVASR